MIKYKDHKKIQIFVPTSLIQYLDELGQIESRCRNQVIKEILLSYKKENPIIREEKGVRE